MCMVFWNLYFADTVYMIVKASDFGVLNNYLQLKLIVYVVFHIHFFILCAIKHTIWYKAWLFFCFLLLSGYPGKSLILCILNWPRLTNSVSHLGKD